MLVILRSIPCMGKTTVAQMLHPSSVLSSDSIRRELFGTENSGNGDIGARVFPEMRRRLEMRMAMGRLTLIDATNLSKRTIRGYTEIAQEYGQEFQILSIQPEPDLAHARLERRLQGVSVGARLTHARLDEMIEKYTNKTPEVIKYFGNRYFAGSYARVEERLDRIVRERNLHRVDTDNVFILGDIHGRLELLKKALAKIPNESLIFTVGDMIDRGEDSMGTLQTIMRDPRFAGFSMGNHEWAFLRELETGGVSKSAPRRVTHKEFEALPVADAAEVKDFIKSGKPFLVLEHNITAKRVLITHAGIDEFDAESMTYCQCVTDKESRVADYDHSRSIFDLIVHGHSSWEYTGDFSGPVVNIDSGCGKVKENPLTVFCPFDESKTFQVS